jgi:hypothetical protein
MGAAAVSAVIAIVGDPVAQERNAAVAPAEVAAEAGVVGAGKLKTQSQETVFGSIREDGIVCDGKI